MNGLKAMNLVGQGFIAVTIAKIYEPFNIKCASKMIWKWLHDHLFT